MRQSKSTKVKKADGLYRNKNFMIFKLLSYVPEFKKDVEEIRKELGIRDGGFGWNVDEILKWASQNNIDNYEEEVRGDEELGLVPYYSVISSQKSDEIIRKTFPSNNFEKKMLDIGTKYRLPFNFFAFPCEGLPRFILSGEIEPPRSNYYIDLHEAGDKSFWTSVTAYTPLSIKELGEATKELRDGYMSTISNVFEGIDAMAKTRYRNNIWRDLPLLEEQVSRLGKPKKVKRSESGSYLDHAINSKSISPKMKKKLERIYKKSVIVEYDKPTSKQIGKKRGLSGEATRQAKKRLNSIAKELFGYDLEP